MIDLHVCRSTIWLVVINLVLAAPVVALVAALGHAVLREILHARAGRATRSALLGGRALPGSRGPITDPDIEAESAMG